MIDSTVGLALYAVRVIRPFLAIIIIYSCYSSMRRNIREDKPLMILHNTLTSENIPVIYWENSIGRSKNSDIILNDPSVSRDHAVLLRREEGWLITDTGSKSGVMLNGSKIHKREQVYIDDVITIGATSLIFKKHNDGYAKRKTPFLNKNKLPKAAPASALLFLVTIFHLLSAFELCTLNQKFDYHPIIPFSILIVLSWAFLAISKFVFKRINFELEALGIFLSGIGIAMICSDDISQSYVQLASIAIGMVVFCAIIKFIENPDRATKWSLFISGSAIALLVVNILLGTVQNGSKNWIIIGPMSIQPSEFVKIAFIFVGASTLDKIQTTKNVTEFIIFSALCIGALFIINDFGTACIFFVTFLIISFMRSGDIKTIILVCAAAVLGAFMILKFKPYVANRFLSWGKAYEYADTLGFQQSRVLTYSASGGLFGVGVGFGDLKNVFAATSDLVFGMICEEMGLIMGLLVAITILGFTVYARRVSYRSRSTFYYISSCSAAGLLLFQMCLNVFGATDVLPLTGVTLPFVSLGGSSMISVFAMLAFIKASDERTYAAKKA